MQIRPFSLPFNVGTDIVHVPRIASLLAGQRASRFLRRVLREEEQRDMAERFGASLPATATATAAAAGPPDAQTTAAMARWVAGRFGAKEAARKAAPHGAGSLGWKGAQHS
ncbi:hypothetical protein KEM52_005881, partial [Ascosphaera acerosa]